MRGVTRGRAVGGGLLLALGLVVSGCQARINEYLVMIRKGDETQVREGVVALGDELLARQESGFEFDEGERLAVDVLREVALSGRDPTSRMAAISALARLDSIDATEVFLQCLDDPRFGVRWEAAAALAAQPEPTTSGELARCLREEERLEVRLYCAKALAAIGDRTALRALLDVLAEDLEPYENLCLIARDAVREMTGEEYPIEAREAWRALREREFGGGGATTPEEGTDPGAEGAAPGPVPEGSVEPRDPLGGAGPDAPGESRP